MWRQMNLSQDEADKHWELYKHIINSIGPENALPFIINTLICYFIQVKNKDTDQHLTKKEIIDMIIEIMKHITRRINEIKEIE